MIPQYARQVEPQYPGRQLAGLGARANAGIGEAAAGLGARVAGWAENKIERADALAASRGWRQLDTWRIQYLQQLPARRKDLAATSVDEVSGASVTGYARELDAFPDAIRNQFEQISSTLSAGARRHLEMAYNQAVPQWSGQAVQILGTMELDDIEGEARELARMGRAADGLDLAEGYRDRLGPERFEKLSAELAISGAQADLQQIAALEGWEKARESLQDPTWQQIYHLEIAEAAGIRNALAGFVAEEAALAESRHLAQLEQNADTFLVAAEKGQADLAAGLESVARNEMPYEVYEQGRKLMTTPPVERIDAMETFLEAERWLSRVREDPTQRRPALDWLRRHAGELPQSWKTYASGYERAGDPDDPAGTPRVKMFDKLLDEHFYDLDTFGKSDTPEAERQYIAVKQRFARYVATHPDATDEELTRFYRDLTTPIVKPSIRRKILDALVGGATGTAYIRNLRNVQPSATEYALGDADTEPATRQEFEDAVKSLPAGSPQQVEYYNRWVKKWR